MIWLDTNAIAPATSSVPGCVAVRHSDEYAIIVDRFDWDETPLVPLFELHGPEAVCLAQTQWWYWTTVARRRRSPRSTTNVHAEVGAARTQSSLVGSPIRTSPPHPCGGPAARWMHPCLRRSRQVD